MNGQSFGHISELGWVEKISGGATSKFTMGVHICLCELNESSVFSEAEMKVNILLQHNGY